MAFDLNMHTAKLLMSEPFFASLSRRIEKTCSTSVPTAGVRVNERGYFEMLYNPDFFEKLEPVQRLGVLKHEFYHVIFEHITGRLPSEGLTKLWNIATDLAINSHLMNELPEKGCFPGKGMFKDFPVGLSAENYMDLLKKMQEEEEKKGQTNGEQGEGGEGSGDPSGQQGEGSGDPSDEGSEGGTSLSDMDSFDDHSQWGKNPASPEAVNKAKERLRKALKDASRDATQSGWGSVSANMRKDIMDRIQSKVDWRKVLRYFIKTSQASNRRSTVKRINRRFPYIHAGRRTERVANIAVSIDQSGSVSDGMLTAFFSELDKLAELATFTVVPFDTDVAEDKIFTWKKGEKRKSERVLCGGTCFDAPTKYVNQNAFDGHIVLTDMCAPKPVASKCQRMWMTDKHHATHVPFTTNERVIAIEA